MVVRAKSIEPEPTMDIAALCFVVIPPETYKALDRVAKQRGLPLSSLLNEALSQYLERTEKR